MQLRDNRRDSQEITASQWLERLTDSTRQDRAELIKWVTAHTDHMRAYLEMLAVEDELRRVQEDAWNDIERFLQTPDTDDSDITQPNRLGFRPEPRMMVLAAGLIAFVIAVRWISYASQPEYTTSRGEWRRIELSDGSSIHLNTDSHLRVHFSKRAREVELLKGEALFDVAHDPSRTFVVVAGATQVLAVGTEFNVYRTLTNTRVSVLDGRVRVRYVPPSNFFTKQANERHSAIDVAAGKEVEVRTGQGIEFAVTDASSARLASRRSWTRGSLLFDGVKLSTAVEEFNRYNKTQIQLAPLLEGDFVLGGTFRSTDIDDFVAAVTTALPLQANVVESSQGRVVYLMPKTDAASSSE